MKSIVPEVGRRVVDDIRYYKTLSNEARPTIADFV